MLWCWAVLATGNRLGPARFKKSLREERLAMLCIPVAIDFGVIAEACLKQVSVHLIFERGVDSWIEVGGRRGAGR